MQVLQKRMGLILLIGILSVYSLGFDAAIADISEVADEMSFNFIAYGDTRGPGTPVSPLHDDIIEDYLAFNPEFIMHTGDLAYHGGEWYQLVEFNESMNAVWESGIPFYVAPGNHEMYTDDWVNDPTFTNYTLYVDYEDIAAACGGTELYYSFDYNEVHFVILNTEHDWIDGDFQLSSEQRNWLEADLGNIDNETFVVVSFHRPVYSARGPASPEEVKEELHDFFVAEGVDLVFNGHNHMYYRTERDGIFYVVTGGGGAPLHDYNESSTTWQEEDFAASEHHYCNVEVNTTHVVVSAYLLNGTILESFFIERPIISTSLSTTTSSIPMTSTSVSTTFTSSTTTSSETTPIQTTTSGSSIPSISTTTSETISSPTGNMGLILALIAGGSLLIIIVIIVIWKRM